MTTHSGMRRHAHPTILRRAILLVLTVLALTACDGLGGEPEIVATIPPPTASPVSIPQSPPDIALGAQIFALNCTSCHGVNGAGDGELVLSGEVMNPGNFTESNATDGQTPQDWFNIITNGNLQALMPPWGEALSEEERWAVTMYSYTLSYDEAQVEAGGEVVAENADLQAALASVTSTQRMMTALTETDLVTFIREAAPDLTSEQVRNVLAFARAESVANFFSDGAPEVAQAPVATEEVADDAVSEEDTAADSEQEAVDPVATEEVSADTDTEAAGQVVIPVINGTAGEAVPNDDIRVILQVFDQEFNFEAYDAEPGDEPDTYVVNNVAFSPDLFYVAEVIYRDRTFFTQHETAISADTESLSLPVTIYELTQDPDVITIIGDVMQIRPIGNSLEVLHVTRFRNDSDRAFTSNEPLDGGGYPSVLVSLPVGASVLGFDNQGRYFVLEEDFAYMDTAMVRPGAEHFTTVSYVLPYEDDAIIEYPVNYDMEGISRILIEDEEMSLEGEGFDFEGPQTISERVFQIYGAEFDLEPGDVIRYELSGGSASVGTSADSGIITSDNLLPLVGLGVAMVMVVGGGLYLLQNRTTRTKPASNDRTIDALVREISDLDADHDAGRINHDVYQRRRAKLKARLAELMDAEGG